MHDSPAHHTLSNLLEKYSGQLLSNNRRSAAEMALKPVMRRYSIPDLDTLAAVAGSGADENLTSACVEAMINNETCFFRDQANFALLTGPLMDEMRVRRAQSKRLRIWSAACSTGQEAYSIAMAIAENEEKWRGWNIDIIGTDISGAALDQAKTGQYSQFEIQRGLPVLLMLKYFNQIGDDWAVKDQLKKQIRFRSHNMLEPAAHFGQFDIILCRNMLMYLSEERRAIVLNSISDSLSSDGMVMLGASETVIGRTDRLNSSREYRGFYAHSDTDAVQGTRRRAIEA